MSWPTLLLVVFGPSALGGSNALIKSTGGGRVPENEGEAGAEDAVDDGTWLAEREVGSGLTWVVDLSIGP
jgi:hypothetical protein